MACPAWTTDQWVPWAGRVGSGSLVRGRLSLAIWGKKDNMGEFDFQEEGWQSQFREGPLPHTLPTHCTHTLIQEAPLSLQALLGAPVV